MLSVSRTLFGMFSIIIFLIQTEGHLFDHGVLDFIRDRLIVQDSESCFNSHFTESNFLSGVTKSTISGFLGSPILLVANEKHWVPTIFNKNLRLLADEHAFETSKRLQFSEESKMTGHCAKQHLSRENQAAGLNSNSLRITGGEKFSGLGLTLLSSPQEADHKENAFVTSEGLQFSKESNITGHCMIQHSSRDNQSVDLNSNSLRITGGERFSRLGTTLLSSPQEAASKENAFVTNKRLQFSKESNITRNYTIKHPEDLNANESNVKGTTQQDERPDDRFYCSHFIVNEFAYGFLYSLLLFGSFGIYLPFILRFFSPTIITRNGIKHVNLEGASPVSFLSVIGNNYFPMDSGDKVTWYKVRMLMALSIQFLLQLFLVYRHRSFFNGGESFLTIIFLLSYACSVFDVICTSLPRKALWEKCYICCNDQFQQQCRGFSIPQRITHHLWQQPLILLMIWKKYIPHVIQLPFVLYSSSSPSSVFRPLLLLPLFMLSIPVVIVLVPIITILAVYFVFFLTSPFSTVVVNWLRSRSSNAVFGIKVGGLVLFLTIAALRIWKTSIWASPLLLSEKNLPYVACFILIFHYLARSYSSFTRKYQDLGSKLYVHYKTTPAVIEEETNCESFSSPVVIIPKELFDRACAQLMPIRKMICIMLLEMIFFLGFVIFVFLSIENSVNAKPAIKSLLTLLNGSLANIIRIFNSSRHKDIEDAALKEKVPKIVDGYNKSMTVPAV